MRYVALEEAFAVPELASRQPATEMRIRIGLLRRDVRPQARRLASRPTTTPRRRATTPGSPTTSSPRSSPVTPPGSKGFAALPTQDPAAAAAELDRAVTQLGFRGALVNDHTHGRYLDDPAYAELWSTLERLGVLSTCTPARSPPTTGTCSTAAPSRTARAGAGRPRPAGTPCGWSTPGSSTGTRTPR